MLYVYVAGDLDTVCKLALKIKGVKGAESENAINGLDISGLIV